MASSATRVALHLLLLALICVIPLRAASSGAGFSVELMHRDHPESPLHDPSATHFGRAMAAARRSRLRVQQMAARSGSPAVVNSVESEITPDVGEYLMTYEVGTPPFQIRAIFDTGSDLTWTNCKPCPDCYPQTAPLFDPAGSSSYKILACGTDACKALPSFRCGDQGACQFYYFYTGGTDLNGTLATETISFATTDGGTTAFPNYPFGCASRTGGAYPRAAAGLVGLSPGALSLMTQLGSAIGRKFSYCLPPSGDPQLKTVLNFGDAAVVPSGAVVTPLLLDNFFYSVNLQKIIVGGKTIPVPAAPAGQAGNIIVDSGTTMTFLVPALLQQVSSGVAELVKLPRSTDAQYSAFGVCFQDQGQPDGGAYPGMSLKFDSGATVQLPPLNAFTKPGAEVVCLAMLATQNRMFLGNLAQQNMHVVHDLDQRKLAFAPADCSKA